ncbi:PAS domain S-box protein [Anabaena azotica]|uniref:histidine kinase n=1 Tax=Anabaena azotica FACHB-119 TaxID=947527 RepID=A0ABR8D7G5_9NOST|nr:PAS domain S-box protein [Anabaena azotica]MBD2502842.1 PAS domain S-box protein [Anabaena azotica FACHB-119]
MQFLPRHLWLRYLESVIDNSPLTVEPETPLSDAISQMASRGVDIVVVANSQVLGYLSATDVVKLVALGVDLQNTRICEVINTGQSFFQLWQFEDVASMMSMLRENQSSCLLLVDEQAQLLGIITSESIYQALEAVTELNNQEQLQISQAPLKLLKSAVVKTDDAISTSEKSLGNIADTRPVLTWVSGKDTLCNFFNKSWLEFTGSSLEQEIGKSWTERVHPEDLQTFLNIYLSAFHTREYFSVEYRLRRFDGKYSWVLNAGVPKFTSGGSFEGYINSCIDINEYKQAFTALQESTTKLKLALEVTQTIYWERNLNNDQLALLNCVDGGGATRYVTHNEAINCIHADDREKFEMAVQEAIARCGSLEVEHRLLAPGQPSEYKWFLSRGKVITDTTGKPTRMIGVSMDITELVQARAAVQQANQEYKTQECFQFLAESLPQQVWIARPDGYIEYVNQRTLEYYGCEPEALLGWQWQQWIHPDDSCPYMEAWLHSVATGDPFEVEFRSLRADHSYRWHLGLAEARRDQQGNIINWFGTNTDIDDRQRPELALRDSEARFRNLVEASSDWLWEVDENAVYTYVNPKVKDILGYEPEEILGKTPFEMMTPKEAERVMNIYAPIAAAQQPYNCWENTSVHKQGHLVVLETSGVPVFDAAGKFCGYRGIDRDITVKKQVENNLYQTQQQLQTILNNCPAIIYVIDLQDRFILINQRYERLLNLTQAEIIGKSIYDTWPDYFARAFALNNRQVLNSGIAIEVEEIVPQEDGLHTYFSIKFPLQDHNGVTYAICGISTDITERKLAENSLLRFHKAMESTSDAIIFSDILDKSIYINPAFEQLYGYSLEELQAHGGVRTVFQQPLERQTILDTVMKGNSWRGEVTMRSRDGRQLKVDMRSDALKDSLGKITGIVCIHTDVTQHQQREEGLRLRDRAIDASSNGIIIADATTPNGPIIYVNPAFERMTGYSSAEVIGQNFRIFQSADIDQPGLRELSAAMQAGKACTVVLRNYRKDGSLLWNEFNISPVYDHTGQLTHYISIQTDITERKQAETALLVSQQRLQYLLTSSPAVIYTSQTFGEFGTIFISDNVTAMTGYEAREFTEDPSFWVSHIHPEDVASVFHKLAHVWERKNYKLEYRFLHKDGKYHWIYDQGRVVQDDINNPIERVGYLIDITERKQLEDYLKVALEKEKELSELKSRFVSMTSHEFRTPLSTILSSSELLEHYRHKWTEEKQLTHLHRIQTAVKRMTEMLNDILIIGKAEAGRLEFVPKSFDIVAYCRTLVEEVQLNRTNHQVYFLSEHEYMSCYMDDKLLGHILSNLISNAIKYSPVSSRVLVKFYCQDERAVFEVQDWGIGIPPEDITHLFESFYRAKNVGNILGTGLGLAIVKKCVDICQGEIFVSSKLGVGTVFTVNLPLNSQI